MYSARQRLRPWLEDKINSGKVPGLCWRDKEKKEFRVSWKHAGKPDFNYEKDAMLFKLWAEHTGKYHAGESPDPSTWKTRFRCALHKMPDVVEVRVPHSLDEKDPYRVFRFTDKGKLAVRLIQLKRPFVPTNHQTLLFFHCVLMKYRKCIMEYKIILICKVVTKLCFLSATVRGTVTIVICGTENENITIENKP